MEKSKTFKNLYRKIYIPIIVIAIVLILFIDVFAIVLQTNALNDSYRSNGEKRIARALDSFDLYLNSAAAFTYGLSIDDDIISALTDPKSAGSISAKLDTVRYYTLKMDAVTLYALSGAQYSSTTVTQTPSLAELKELPEIADFVDGEASAAVSARNDKIAGLYYNASYPAENGVISCCQKVYDGESTVGYIFTDILTSNLYDHIFAGGQFKDAIAFISFNDVYFAYNGNSEHKDLLTSDSSAYFSYTGKTDDGAITISVFDSKYEYNMQIIKLAMIMLGVSAALIVFVVIAARYTAKRVTSRLDGLIDKMSSQQFPNT